MSWDLVGRLLVAWVALMLVLVIIVGMSPGPRCGDCGRPRDRCGCP